MSYQAFSYFPFLILIIQCILHYTCEIVNIGPLSTSKMLNKCYLWLLKGENDGFKSWSFCNHGLG